MTSNAAVESIQQRLGVAGVRAHAEVVSGCAAYLELLAVWNRRINLTALPLGAPFSDESVDRLIVEPLLAGAFVHRDAVWADIGSGGGSPAIPLKISRPGSTLTMVETRERKCAFLREAVRVLALPRATVFEGRFEDADLSGLDVLTVRAVKLDANLMSSAAAALSPGGVLLAFGGTHSWVGFTHEATVHLPGPRPSGIQVLRRI